MTIAHPNPLPWHTLDILVISPTPTHPQDHGNRKRIFELCSELKRQGASIHFVHYASELDWRDSRPSNSEAEMVAAWDSYQFVVPSRPLHETATGTDHLIDEWADPALSAYIRWIFRTRTFDVVVVEYTWMSFCFDSVPEGVFKICDTHDVFGGRRRLLEANGVSPEFFYTTPEEEKKGLARADLVWAIKDAERSYFESVLGLPSCLTMLYSEAPRGWWVGKPSKDGWLRVGIIGAKNNVNRRNLEAFISTALPIFEAYMAPVKLVIAGGCSDDFKAFQHPSVQILGRLTDVAGFYSGVDIICAPVQFSTGLKIKVAEALASGAPLVGHAHAMEGYPVLDPLHELPSFEAIARALVRLAFDDFPLVDLAEKSAILTRQIQAAVQDSLERTLERIVAAGARRILIVAPLEALYSHTLLNDHLYATLSYLCPAARVALFICGLVVKFEPDRIRPLPVSIPVFIAPESVDAIDGRWRNWRSLDLATVLRTRGITQAYFLSPDARLTDIGPGTLRKAFVRYDAVQLLGVDPMVLVEALCAITSVVVIAAAAIPVGCKAVHAVARVPFGVNALNGSFASRVLAGEGWRGLLILAKDNDPLVAILKELARRLRIPVAVLNVFDPEELRALGGNSSRRAPENSVTGARMVVDLGTGIAVSALILEAAQRAGIPAIKFARGASAAGLQQVEHEGRASTIGSLVRTVATSLVEGNARRQLIEAARRESENLGKNHPGWAWLIREITRKTPLVADQSALEALFG